MELYKLIWFNPYREEIVDINNWNIEEDVKTYNIANPIELPEEGWRLKRRIQYEDNISHISIHNNLPNVCLYQYKDIETGEIDEISERGLVIDKRLYEELKKLPDK